MSWRAKPGRKAQLCRGIVTHNAEDVFEYCPAGRHIQARYELDHTPNLIHYSRVTQFRKIRKSVVQFQTSAGYNEFVGGLKPVQAHCDEVAGS